LRPPGKSNVTKGDRLAVASDDQLAALILRRYVTPMAHGGPYIQDWLDLFAFEGLFLAGRAPAARIVLALGPQHRSPPVARRASARAERCMPAAASPVKMGERAAPATVVATCRGKRA
jgi:hypothetical protein